MILLKNFKLLILLLTLLLQPSLPINAQVNFTDNIESQPISVCDGSVPLKIEFTVAEATAGSITVTVDLAEGVEYAGGLSLISTSPVAGLLAIAEANMGNPRRPIFTITDNNGDGNIAIGEAISFKFNRKATCAAWAKAAAASTPNLEFKDKITVSLNGNSRAVETLGYNIYFPNLTVVAPAPINNKQLSDKIERTFTIANGSVHPTSNVYLVIDYGADAYFSAAGAQKLEVAIDGGAFVEVAPFETVGGKRTYILTGSYLGSDHRLTNGEIITLRETFNIMTCGLTTNYSAGWGCSVDNQCEIKEANSIITMSEGVAKWAFVSANISNFTSPCQPFTATVRYKNDGTGGNMGAMYDLSIIGVSAAYMLHKHLGVKIGSSSVPNVFASAGGRRLQLDLNNLLNEDPDGPGVGLEDLDKDGYYDDLAPNATVTIEMQMLLACDEWSSCGNVRQIVDYPFSTNVMFHTACDKHNWVESGYVDAGGSFMQIRRSVQNSSSIPANIQAEQPFTIDIMARWYLLLNSYTGDNTRIVTEIDLVPGLDINPANVKWIPMTAVSNGFNFGTPVAPASVTRRGNTLVIVAPARGYGYVKIENAIYHCQTGANTLAIDYRMKEIIDYVNYPDCECPAGPMICGTFSPRVAGCGGGCVGGGPSTGLPVIEREDNSLGWTDHTMSILQSRENISSYDLSKALYLDEIRVTSKAVQHGAASNLGAHLRLTTDTKKKAGLTPLSADIIIKRGTVTVVEATNHTVFNSTVVNGNAEQAIDWDFTSLLPAEGLLDGDSIKVVTRYQVTSENYPLVDEQTGRNWYIYNSTSSSSQPVWVGEHKSCTSYVPEFYLVGTFSINGVNRYQISGCQSIYIGGAPSHIARRFNSGGVMYAKEYRPGLKLNYYYVKFPKSYHLNSVSYRNARRNILVPLTLESTIDDGTHMIYKYKVPDDDLSHMNITVTNSYGAFFFIKMSPTCASSDNPSAYDMLHVYMEYVDYYYYAAKQTSIPPSLKIDAGLDRNMSIQYTKKPSIELINQTGEVELAGKTGSWTVRYNNASSSAAPYTWLAIPNTSGLTITKVSRLSDGQEIAPIPYAGGKMYHLSNVGVLTGHAMDYKVEFSYTGCIPISVEASGGWNCSDFPASPSEYICNPQTIDLKLKPATSAMELQQVSVPPTDPAPTLCSNLEYTYRLRATDKGNLYHAALHIVPDVGLELLNNQAEVCYPTGSSNWETIPLNNVNGVYTVDVMAHSGLAAIGYLKGTVEASSGANNTDRQVDIRFSIKTDCNFVSGKNFKVKTTGKNACNVDVKGASIVVGTPSIEILGATRPYAVTSNLEFVNSATNVAECKAPKTIKASHVVLDGATGTNDKLEIVIPLGFKYVTGSYAPTATPAGNNAVSAGSEILTVTPNGEDVLKLNLKPNLGNLTQIEYTFQIEEGQQHVPACGTYQIEATGIAQIPGLSCAGVTCPGTSILTGTSNFSFELSKAAMALSVLSASAAYNGTGEDIAVEYKLENTSDITLKAGTLVTLFSDKDNNRIFSPGDVVVGTHSLPTDVVQGTPLTETLFATNVSPYNACDLRIAIFPKDGCICDIVLADVTLSTLSGIAGTDMAICANDHTPKLLGTPANNGYSYHWSSPDPNVMIYLSDDDVAQPSFTYTDEGVNTELTLTYRLTITRLDGCSAFDLVTVKLLPAPATPSVSTTYANNCGLQGKIVVAQQTGASYSINGTEFQSDNTFTGLAAGIYTVYVKKSSDCVESVSVTIYMDSDCDGYHDDEDLDDDNDGILDTDENNCGEITCDKDNDGIPNHLDLDSDGDGCSDALEGGDAILTSDLVITTMPGGSTNVQQNLGNTVGTILGIDLGVPVIVNAGGKNTNNQIGQSVHYAQEASKNSCKNYWSGTPTSTDWGISTNWTANEIPATGEDVEFATKSNNNGSPAKNDLVLDQNRTIGSLINQTTKKTIIPAGKTLTISGTVTGSGTMAEASKIHVKASPTQPNGTLILAGQPCTVPVFGTVELYARGYEGVEQTWTDNISGSPTFGQTFKSSYHWQYFGVPVESIQPDPTFYRSYIREYDETYNGDNSRYYWKWRNLNNASTLNAFKGYEITQQQPITYWIPGRLQHCDKTLTMTRMAPEVRNASGQNIRYGLGQNVFGNSYTAAIKIDQMVIPEEVEKTVYLYNTGRFHDWATTGNTVTTEGQIQAGNYLAVPVNASVVFDNQIPSMQGFLLKFTDAQTFYSVTGADVKIKYASGGVVNNTKPQLVGANSSFTSELSYLNIRLESATTVDNLWLFSHEKATEGFDNGWDGRKFFGTPTAFIYSETPDGPMQVNATSGLNEKIITFHANSDVDYTLRLTKHGLEEYDNLYLVDRHTHTYTRLEHSETVYKFRAATANVSEQRFMIIDRPDHWIADKVHSGLLHGYLNADNELILTNYTGILGTVRLISTAGQLMQQDVLPTGSSTIPVRNLSEGVYLLRLDAGTEHTSIKVIVRKK